MVLFSPVSIIKRTALKRGAESISLGGKDLGIEEEKEEEEEVGPLTFDLDTDATTLGNTPRPFSGTNGLINAKQPCLSNLANGCLSNLATFHSSPAPRSSTTYGVKELGRRAASRGHRTPTRSAIPNITPLMSLAIPSSADEEEDDSEDYISTGVVRSDLIFYGPEVEFGTRLPNSSGLPNGLIYSGPEMEYHDATRRRIGLGLSDTEAECESSGLLNGLVFAGPGTECHAARRGIGLDLSGPEVKNESSGFLSPVASFTSFDLSPGSFLAESKLCSPISPITSPILAAQPVDRSDGGGAAAAILRVDGCSMSEEVSPVQTSACLCSFNYARSFCDKVIRIISTDIDLETEYLEQICVDIC